MADYGASRQLREHWRVFLTKNLDARLIVDGAMTRMGLSEDEVLFLLMDAWTTQHLTQEQQGKLYKEVCQTTVN